jgi:hypothetical protein
MLSFFCFLSLAGGVVVDNEVGDDTWGCGRGCVKLGHGGISDGVVHSVGLLATAIELAFVWALF